MSADMTDDRALDLAQRLLDAQVAFMIAELTGDRLDPLAAEIVDDLLATAADLRLADAVDRDEVTRIARRIFATVPPSTAASTLVQAAADVLHDGPTDPWSAGDVVAREHVEQIVDEIVRAQPLIKAALDDVVESPLVAAVVSRFVARVVGDVLASNRAVAEKLPGIGGLVSFGAGAASKIAGAGASGVEQLLGDTAGKGAQLAARRLNKVAVDTLADPQLKAAVLELWDARSEQQIPPLSHVASQDDLRRVAGLVQDVAIHAAASDPVSDLLGRLIGAFFDLYGDHPLTTLLDELAIERDDLVADAQAAARRALTAAQEAGRLDPFLRARLEPFYRSDAFRQAVT